MNPSKPRKPRTFVCIICGAKKFFTPGTPGDVFSTCWDCHYKPNKEYWATKKNKKCGTCGEVKPLEDFGVDAKQFPWPECWACCYAETDDNDK